MSTENHEIHPSARLLGRCLELLQTGHLDLADHLAEEGLESYPDDGALWQVHGLIRHRMGDTQRARASLEIASMLVPLTTLARCALAQCFARTGLPDLARDLYLHLAQDARTPVGLLPAVASGLGSLGEHKEALGVCREIIRQDPLRHEAHFGEAYYLRRLGHSLEAAIAPISRAHQLAPAVPLYRIARATLMLWVGDHDEAYDLLRGVDPRSVTCRCCLNRMMSVFLRAGDHACLDACRAREETMENSEHWSLDTED